MLSRATIYNFEITISIKEVVQSPTNLFSNFILYTEKLLVHNLTISLKIGWANSVMSYALKQTGMKSHDLVVRWKFENLHVFGANYNKLNLALSRCYDSNPA